METDKLSLKVKLGYGICDLGGNLYFTVIAFLLLNFLTDTLGLGPGPAGLVIMAGKIWDAVTDPAVGFISDRTRSRWGRRRPFIFWGSFPLWACMVLMFTHPGLSHPGQLFAWALVVYCLLCFSYTLVNIPYNALTPELTRDFHERTRLNGFRFGFAMVGTLVGAGAALPIVQSFENVRLGYTVLGALFGFLMLATAMVTVFTVKEPRAGEGAEETGQGLIHTYAQVFKNRPYVIILTVYTLHVTALTMVSGMAIYYFKYIHGDESRTTLAMLILLGTAMALIPPSVYLAGKWGKKTVYALGLVLFALGGVVLYLFGHQYGPGFSYAVMALAGIGMGLTHAMPYSMVPDTVEYDYLNTGVRREGAYYGIWTFGIKLGQAVALGVTGLVLSWTGYQADAVQSQAAAHGIRFLMGPLPGLIFLFAAGLLLVYPITRARYEEILSRIQARENENQ